MYWNKIIYILNLNFHDCQVRSLYLKAECTHAFVCMCVCACVCTDSGAATLDSKVQNHYLRLRNVFILILNY